MDDESGNDERDGLTSGWSESRQGWQQLVRWTKNSKYHKRWYYLIFSNCNTNHTRQQPMFVFLWRKSHCWCKSFVSIYRIAFYMLTKRGELRPFDAVRCIIHFWSIYWKKNYLNWSQTANVIATRRQSNLTKSASRGAHSPVRGHPRGRKLYHWIPGVGFPISVP